MLCETTDTPQSLNNNNNDDDNDDDVDDDDDNDDDDDDDKEEWWIVIIFNKYLVLDIAESKTWLQSQHRIMWRYLECRKPSFKTLQPSHVDNQKLSKKAKPYISMAYAQPNHLNTNYTASPVKFQ